MSSIDVAQQFESILRSYLTRHQSLADTINQLATPIETAYVTADPSDDGPTSASSLLWLLWQVMISIAQSLPYDNNDGSQSKLVDLLAELKQRSTPSVPAEKLEQIQDQDPWSLAPIWQNLAIWGWQLRESFDVLDPLPGGARPGTASPSEWVNLNTFLARLTKAGVSEQSFFGVVVLQTTLEEQRDSWNEKDIETKSAAIGAAATWLFYMGDSWYRHGWRDESMAGNPRPSWSLWKGTPFKIDQARIRFWVNRLAAVVSETQDLADEWKSLADRTIQGIDSL